jgi:hypothetical protein
MLERTGLLANGRLQVLIIGYLIDIFILRNNHVGFPMTMLTVDNMISLIKVSASGSAAS